MAAGKSKSVRDLGVGGSGLCSSGKRRIFFNGHLFKMQLREEKGRRAGSEICVCNRVCVCGGVSCGIGRRNQSVFLLLSTLKGMI